MKTLMACLFFSSVLSAQTDSSLYKELQHFEDSISNLPWSAEKDTFKDWRLKYVYRVEGAVVWITSEGRDESYGNGFSIGRASLTLNDSMAADTTKPLLAILVTVPYDYCEPTYRGSNCKRVTCAEPTGLVRATVYYYVRE